MDIKATATATDSDLSRLGIAAKGNIIALRAFCAKSEAPTTNVEKKKQLLQAVKKSGRIAKDEPKKAKPKLCYIGSMQDSANQKKYVNRGDCGTRQHRFAPDATIDDILNFGKSKLFVDGNHPQ